jgi:hypothetical protein
MKAKVQQLWTSESMKIQIHFQVQERERSKSPLTDPKQVRWVNKQLEVLTVVRTPIHIRNLQVVLLHKDFHLYLLKELQENRVSAI